MRWGLLASIHSNVYALEATLEKLRSTRVDRIAVLGDIVGCGPRPEETISMVRENAHACVIGDHDAAVLGRVDLSRFDPKTVDVIHWTKEQLSKASLEWLGKRTKFTHHKESMLIHGNPFDPLFGVIDKEIAEKIWEKFAFNIIFLGHLMHPMVITKKYDKNITDDEKINVEPHSIVGVGSVGWRVKEGVSHYVIWDVETNELEFGIAQYDGKRVLDDIKKKIPKSSHSAILG